MVGITPTDIGKHKNLIKAAQDELNTMDVLVCGRCLSVFHFTEEFRQHKLKPCSKENSNVRDCNDTKPKIWAFLLWKATQLQSNKDSNTVSPTSWSLYQNWVKMEEGLRETWIVAGKTIQSFAKVGMGGLQEMPVKITKTVVNNSPDNALGRRPLAQTKPQVTNLRPTVKQQTQPQQQQLPQTQQQLNESKEANLENETSVVRGGAVLQKVVKKPVATGGVQNVPQNRAVVNSVTPKAPTSRFAKRTPDATEENSNIITEEIVEKIVAKRFNPRRKMHEYLVKWESRGHEANTWEPAAHLESVPQMLETFERQLQRQKETRAAINAKQQQQQQQQQQGIENSPTSPLNERPSRTSKTKAMDQVKQWVSGTNAVLATPADDSSGENETSFGSQSSFKRKLNDSDYNDSAGDLPLTTTTMEDLEEDLIPSHTVKRLKNGDTVSVEVKTKNESNSKIIVNGVANASADLGSNSVSIAEIIITQDSNASGVVKKPGVNGNLVSSKNAKQTKKQEAQVRVLSKGESAVSNSGIVRVGATTIQKPMPRSATVGNTQITTVSSQRQQVGRTPGGTTIQRRTVTSNVTTLTSGRNTQATSSSGRMVIPPKNTPGVQRTANASKNVTPEQKILQLSKSGDLKVTKKVMTPEDAMAQRMTTQQRQRYQQQQQQQQQQSQVQIQKVQQITPPVSRTSSARKQSEQYEHQAQLCPITGKILGADGQEVIIAGEQQQMELEQQQMQEVESNMLLGEQVLTNEEGSPILVTGEDGTVYQVAGKNAEGQTILVTTGPDGEQQFAYLAPTEGEENQMLTLDNAVAEAVAQLPVEHQGEGLTAITTEGGQYLVKTANEDGTTQVVALSEAEFAQHQALMAQQQATTGGGAPAQICIQTEGADGEANIPAEVVQADPPSPGGTRRVMLMLQDGTFMVTEMHESEFSALNINA